MWRTFLVVVGAILFGPLVILLVFSFNDSNVLAMPFEGLTLRWYRIAFSDSSLHAALLNSTIVALVVAPLCLILGTLAAFGLTRFRFRGRAAVAGLVAAPLVLPWLVIGNAALMGYAKADVTLGLPTVIATQAAVLLVGMGFVSRLPGRPPVPGQEREPLHLRELRAGLSEVIRSPILRPVFLLSISTGMFFIRLARNSVSWSRIFMSRYGSTSSRSKKPRSRMRSPMERQLRSTVSSFGATPRSAHFRAARPSRTERISHTSSKSDSSSCRTK